MQLLIISHDVIGNRMAGTGIRYWELAHTLAADAEVTLIAPRPIDGATTAVRCGDYAWEQPGALAGWLAGADAVLANGFVLQAHPELAQAHQPLALDLYDPLPLENLELFRAAPIEQRTVQQHHDIGLLERQLAAGDFFVCATERQRDLYIGALMAHGRLTPAMIDADANLRRLIDVVSSGLASAPPTKQQPALRGVVPGIGPDDVVLLWTGGLWDWLDPLTLVRALPQVVGRLPQTKLVFLAGQHPGSVQPMQMPGAARGLSAELGLLDEHVFFYDAWVPYAERADFLLEADLAVSLHRDHLETAYAAVRSRFLDHLWAGLPSVVSAGDAAADLVARYELGAVVPPGSVDALAAALSELVGNAAQRRQCAANAQSLAASFTWQQVAAPLRRFCRDPQPAADQTRRVAQTTPREEPPVEEPTPITPLDTMHLVADAEAERQRQAQAHDQQRNAVLQAMGARWQVAEPALPGGPVGRLRQWLVYHIVRPFVVPLIEQQNAQNAAVIRAIDALAESSDTRRSETYALVNQRQGALEQKFQHYTDERAGEIERRISRFNERVANAERHVGQVETLAGKIAANDEHTRKMVRQFVADLEESDTLLAERIAALLAERDEEPQ